MVVSFSYFSIFPISINMDFYSESSDVFAFCIYTMYVVYYYLFVYDKSVSIYTLRNGYFSWVVVAQAFNPST